MVQQWDFIACENELHKVETFDKLGPRPRQLQLLQKLLRQDHSLALLHLAVLMAIGCRDGLAVLET